MKHDDPLHPIHQATLSELLDAIASAEPSSGAGIAAALGLALSASCAMKAVAVTRRHTADATLEERSRQLRELRERALLSARRDEELFRKYLQERKPRDAAMLVEAAKDFQTLAREIGLAISASSANVYDSVTADMEAARTLLDASANVGALIMRDNRQTLAKTVR